MTDAAACESIYNICKVGRKGCLAHFRLLFDAVCKLVADGDSHVRNAAQVWIRFPSPTFSLSPLSQSLSFTTPLTVAKRQKHPLSPPQLLDRLLKDIVAEAPSDLDLQTFIPLLADRCRAPNPYIRQFLISWVMTLDSLPGTGIPRHLPHLMEAFLDMLKDAAPEIRHAVSQGLREFTQEIMQGAEADLEALARILVR